MKRFSKSTQGVTLLEIMLVLAIAAMIIVMSVRYYQSATSSQQTNAVLQQVQAITAAADGLAQASGSYSAVTSSKLTTLLPANGLKTPWGTSMTYAAGASGSTYTITIQSTPAAVCPLLVARLGASKNFSVTSTCGTTAADVVYKYISNP